MQSKPRRWRSATVALLGWLYLICILAIWLFLRLEADRSLLGMIVVFAPRWVLVLPLIALFPLALMFNRRCIWILTSAAIVACFPLMGLCIPWKSFISADDGRSTIRVLSCNIHHHAVDTFKLSSFIAAAHPDIVVLQEWMPIYQTAIFGADNWTVITSGDVCIATRFPIHRVKELPKSTAVEYAIETPAGMIEFLNVHLSSPHLALRDTVLGRPNGKPDLEKNLANRRDEARELNRVTQGISAPLLIAGDFNLPSDSAIFYENFSRFSDAYRTAGFGFGWTYYSRWTTTRIDHILGNGHWDCRRCWVGPQVGSPHRPLVADLEMK